MKRVLVIGSGHDATDARKWDLKGWQVCAINNAWSVVPDSVDFHIRAGDWIPSDDNCPPDTFYDRARHISYKDYDSPVQHGRFGKQGVGIGSTMLFNAAYWALGNIGSISTMCFIGCSMFYPMGSAHTFYNKGNADPLRFSRAYLRDRFNILEQKAASKGTAFLNLGSVGIMPYRRGHFANTMARPRLPLLSSQD